MILLCKILSGCWFFSLFISTTFIAILFVFLLMKSKKENVEFRQAFIENFANEDKKEDEKKEEKKDDTEIKVEEKKVDVIVEEKKIPMSVDDAVQISKETIDKPNPIEIKAIKETKISMMDKDENLDEDFFGKLDTGEFEDSDDDSSDDEAGLEKKVGKTNVSSKKAYKAQKQLYDLSTAVNKLHDNMEKLAPSLKKGQKIMEQMSKLGLNFV